MSTKLFYASEENGYEIDVREFTTLESAKAQLYDDIAEDVDGWRNHPQAIFDYNVSEDGKRAEGIFGADYHKIYIIAERGECKAARKEINELRREFIAMF